MKKVPGQPVLASNNRLAVARSLADLSSSQQLHTIESLGRKKKIDPNQVSLKLFGCRYEELSASGAADVIASLRDIEPRESNVLTFPGGKIEKQDQPEWFWTLQYMAQANMPIFIGCLEDDWWKEDEFLTGAIEKGWIRLVPGEGFLITDAGRQVVEENGGDTTPRDREQYIRWTNEYKAHNNLSGWTSDKKPAVATCLANLCRIEQLEAMKDLAKRKKLDANEIPRKLFGCRYDELTESGADDVVRYLNECC